MANIVRTTHMVVTEVDNPEPGTDIFIEPYQDDGYDSLEEALDVWALHDGLARMTLDGAHEPDSHGSYAQHDSSARPSADTQQPQHAKKLAPTDQTEVDECDELDAVPDELVVQPHDISPERTDQVKHPERKRTRTRSDKHIKNALRKHFGDIPVTKEFLEEIRSGLADDLAELSGESSSEHDDETPSDKRTKHGKHSVVGAQDTGDIDAIETPTCDTGYGDELERQAERDAEQAECEAEQAEREAEQAELEAELEAQRLAELEAQREADLEAKRQAEAKRIKLDELAAEREAGRPRSRPRRPRSRPRTETRWRSSRRTTTPTPASTAPRACKTIARPSASRATTKLPAPTSLPCPDDILAGRDDYPDLALPAEDLAESGGRDDYPDLALSAEDLAAIDAETRKRPSSGGIPPAKRPRPDDNVSLTTEQQAVADIILAGEHPVFVTGQAGTRKSLLIARGVRMLEADGKTVAVTAGTVTASLLIEGGRWRGGAARARRRRVERTRRRGWPMSVHDTQTL